MVSEEAFAKRVEELRKVGAKYIFLKTVPIARQPWLWQ